jgi:hypothetical protein
MNMIAHNHMIPDVGSYILSVDAWLYTEIDKKLNRIFSVYSLPHFQSSEMAQS